MTDERCQVFDWLEEMGFRMDATWIETGEGSKLCMEEAAREIDLQELSQQRAA